MLWNMSGKVIAVWGLAFKPDTDDIRSAPSIDIINRLLAEGASIRAYDPVAMDNSRKEFADSQNIEFCSDVYDAAKSADCIVLMTEWNEFKEVDWNKIKKEMVQPFLLDGRNIYDPKKLRDLGFTYEGIGRGV